jgi:signal transduction histidine kinase
MKISSFILVSFLFILLLFSITTYINFQLSEQVKDNAEFLAKSTEIVRNSARFQRNTINMVSGLRGFLLTGEKDYIQTYDSASLENETILKELTTLTYDSSQKILLNEIKLLHDKWVEEYSEPLRQAKLLANINDSNITAYNRVYREKSSGEKVIQSRLQQKFREFSNWEYEKRDERRAMLATSAQQTKRTSLILTFTSLVAALVIVAFLIRRISSRIDKMVNMADSIASGNYNVNMKDLGKDELTALVQSLNHMSNELATNISLLKTKNEELDQFAHIVSHDLKGPLRGIDNVITWIEEDHQQELSPKLQEYLKIIKGRVIRTENLIQGILSYARIGKEVVPKEEVDVNELLEEVKESIPPSSNIQLKAEKLPTLYTERIPLFQVLSNLISNAVKYNDKEKGEVKVYHIDKGDRYEFFVEDNGPGISEHYHKKIFVIFQTLKDRDTFESTGVGLAIVKKILDARTETIKINSEPGKGSTFSFTWSKN